MRAGVVTEKKVISVQDIPKPKVGPDEVVVQVKYCGLCGSEVSPYAKGAIPVGSIIGHELAGEVAEIGSGVRGWRPGDRVVSSAYGSCGVCDWCSHGQPNICDNKSWIGLGFNPGGLAEYCKVKASMLYRIPEELPFRNAALTEPLAVALHAIRNAHPNLGDTAAVIGVGAIGLLILQAIRLAGIVAVAAIDTVPSRLEAAANMGANVILKPEDATEATVTAAVGELPTFIFVCRLRSSTLQLATKLVRPRGVVVLVGVNSAPIPVTTKEWMRKEITLRTSMAYTQEFPIAIRLLTERKIDVNSVISHVVGLDEVDNVLKAIRHPNGGYLKVLVKP